MTLGATSRTFTLAAAGAARERTQAVLLRGLSDATEVGHADLVPRPAAQVPRRRSSASASTAVAGGGAAWFGLVCSLAEGKAAELAEQAGLVGDGLPLPRGRSDGRARGRPRLPPIEITPTPRAQTKGGALQVSNVTNA